MHLYYKKISEKFFRRRTFKGMLGFLGFLSVAGIWGCSSAVPEMVVPEGPLVTEVQQDPRASQSAGMTREPTMSEQSFRLEEMSAHDERGQTTVRMKFSRPIEQYRHFPMSQPSRIVLDVFGDVTQMGQVENFRVDSNWIGAMRLSSSEGYLRAVMEIGAAEVPLYTIEMNEAELTIVIGPENPESTTKKDIVLIQEGQRKDVRIAEGRMAAEGPPGRAAAEAVPGEKKEYTGQRISLDFKDADIKNVFRLLAQVSGRNIVVTDDVRKRVTVRLVDVPWDQAMDLLITTNGLGRERVGNVDRISTEQQLKSERDLRAAAIKAQENLEPLRTAYLNVNYAKVTDLVPAVQQVLSPRGTITPDLRSNTILVRDIGSAVENANEVVSRLDTRTPQVQIETNLIETTPTFARALGLELSFDARINNNPERRAEFRGDFEAGSPFSLGAASFGIIQDRVGVLRDITSRLSAAEREGNIRIISRPSILTLNNVQSTIQSLRVLRITLPDSTNIASGTGAAAGAAVATEKVNVGIVLTVTPQVSADGFVLMNISVKSSSIAESATVTTSQQVLPFDELTREAIANVLVRDGETIVIGGIMKDTRLTSESGWPYLKDIPVLGWLFRNIRWQKDFEELMVFITPRIIVGGSANLPNAEELWRNRLRMTEGS